MEKLNHYDACEVIDRFEINKILDHPLLAAWLNNAAGTLKSAHREVLEEARLQLTYKWDEWNEEELKMNFVSLVIFVAQLDVPKFISTYYERKLSGEVQEIPISVTADCMLASPTFSGRPKMPYFFLQEFKRSLGDNHDPEGQMLAAMILSQELNKDNKPLYGSWIQGRFWYFTTLIGKDYSVSKPFNATEPDDLLKIVLILRQLKEIILAR